MKKRIFALCTAALLLFGCGASGSSDTDITAPEPTADSSQFAVYPSNTYIATGNNYCITAADAVSYRAYLPVETPGALEYCFYFSNTVDSTWGKGEVAFVNKPGAAYTVSAASVGISAEIQGAVLNEQPVTFSGQAQKSVSPSETYWSDPLTVDVPAGNYLVWTWTVQGDAIPATVMSDLTPTYAAKAGGQFIYTNEIPLPQLIGAKRDVKKRIVHIGDSITQGTGTPQYENAFWVSDIAKSLDAEYSVWNLGLGYSRASDCVLDGDWLQRARHADLVTVAFGTNDMQGGQYGVGAPNAAPAINTWLSQIVTKLRDAGCEVVLFNAPPFDLPALNEGIRAELNQLLPDTAAQTGATLFDWASLLEQPDAPGRSLYGGHPNAEGCKVVADAFLKQFADKLN